MQILTGKLRQLVYLILQDVIQAAIAIAETRCRIPHLQDEVRDTLAIVKVVALGALEKFRRIQVMDRVAPRAVFAFEFKQFLLAGCGRRFRTIDSSAHIMKLSGYALSQALTRASVSSFRKTRAGSQRSR